MTKREQYEARTEKLILPILEEMGFELVDTEYVKEGADYYLRAYIDKEEGINIQDCEAVSRRMSDLLDEEDFIPDAYIFEVSSPGLGRQLKKDKDFTRNIGKKVEMKLFKAACGRKELTGVLVSFDAQNVTVADEQGQGETFRRSDIAVIKQYVEF